MCLTKGGTAIHATSCLDLPLDGSVFLLIASFDGVEFFPVEDTTGGVTVRLFVALVVDETAELFNWLIGSITTFHSVSEAKKRVVRCVSTHRMSYDVNNGEFHIIRCAACQIDVYFQYSATTDTSTTNKATDQLTSVHCRDHKSLPAKSHDGHHFQWDHRAWSRVSELPAYG